MNPRYQQMFTGIEGSFFVRVEGLEPPWIAPPDPKSGMSTNFTTPAWCFFVQLHVFRHWTAFKCRPLVKKGVQIYRYFVTINEKNQNSKELIKPRFCFSSGGNS